MRIPQRFWSVRLDQVDEAIRPKIDRYLRRLDEHLDWGEGLLLWGDNGVGKTSAAVLIALEVRRRGASVLFITAEGLRQAVLERERFDDDQTVIERARAVDFLVLDDLGKEHPGETGFTERLFENLIRERVAARRTTVMTTNLPMSPRVDGNGRESKALKNVYVPSMLEVMKEALYPLRFVGENLREAKREEMTSRMACG
jgi:DNA replication protein DnaC